jgi:putative transposase
MVAHPRDYRWSSYRANAEGEASTLVSAHNEYRRLGQSELARQAAYRGLFDGLPDPAMVTAIRDATNGNIALGNDRFQHEIKTILGQRAHRGAAGRPRLRK